MATRRKTAHPSDSSAQREAEAIVLEALSERLGFPVKGERVGVGDGVHIMVDGINRENRFACEVFCRIGRLQAAQVEKVANDMLKLMLLERALGGRWRKAICFVSDEAARTVRNRSWLATMARLECFETFVIELPSATSEAVLTAQARQIMVNKPADERDINK